MCSASAAARKRSISARESCSEGLVLAIGACAITNLVKPYVLLGSRRETGRSSYGAALNMMFFPRLLIGMFATSTVVATWIYLATDSFWKSLAWTLLIFIIFQVAYFLFSFALFDKLWLKRTEEIPNPAEPTCRDGGVSSEGRSMTL
ncbi:MULTISPECIES: hypothetical protein [unclassified Mesorhizobium]|uniref:hypothetical protein n=1 Tax=unclassified Mesorhizobium TaxID=325217 RepID=UPI001FD9077C|nr:MULTISPECIES: hypothetical protein [unclassified Mesorhizobium]WJI48325.1 hypothetical protein NL532_20685 [Mesorhizobium sp. C120A]